MDRRKATDAKDPPVAEDFNGVMAPAEPVSGLSSHPENSEEEEVCVWSGAFLLLQPLLACLRDRAAGTLPSLILLSGKKMCFRIDSLEQLVGPMLP